MQVELYCPSCSCRFAAAPETPAAEIIDRMAEEGPWYALGDGETFEDMIFTALTSRGEIRCPECGEPVSVTEESLGQLAMEVLGSW
ncbi:MAG TPA: hypothetical protein VFA26_23260 [Gemmataceae bacterium]|nr:hypothetical protein [Gemmataceae bacterium]